jgi:CBS domain-containing protein
LDGGRVLRSALWHWKANLRWATRITSRLGAGFGVALMVLAVVLVFGGNLIGAIWWFLIGMFLRNAAHMSYQQVLVRQMLQGEPVHRFMKRDVIAVTPDVPLDRFVDDYVYRHHHKVYPAVQEDGRIIGCVNAHEVKQFERDQWPLHTVGEIVTRCSADNTIRGDADAMDALEKMSRNDQTRLMVVDDGHLEGIIALRDLLSFLRLKVELEEGEPLHGRL